MVTHCGEAGAIQVYLLLLTILMLYEKYEDEVDSHAEKEKLGVWRSSKKHLLNRRALTIERKIALHFFANHSIVLTLYLTLNPPEKIVYKLLYTSQMPVLSK